MIEYLTLNPVPAATAIIAVVLAVLLYLRKDRTLAPGPTGLPFLGYYPFLKDEYHLQLNELSKKYGDVFTFSVTGQSYVHINSLKILREAFVSKSECFDSRGRRRYSIINHCYDGGMAFQEGEAWKVLRKFYVQTLKEFGLNSLKGNMAGPVYNALQAMIEELRSLSGTSFDSVAVMTKHCTTIVQELLFCGVEIAKKDLEDLNKAYLDMLNAMRGTNLLLSGPIAKYVILPYVSGYREMAEGRKTMDSILMKIVRDHESSLNEDNPRDFVDCYIKERNVRLSKEDPTARYFTNESLAASFIQFLGDGSLTNGFFVSLFLDAMVKHPEVQEKIHSELLEVVGTDRQPTMEDKTRLPYTNAAVLEILRLCDFAPIFPSLMCTKETTLGGHRIQEGCIIVVNFYSIMHNPDLYKDPETFDPTRFISSPDKPKEESPVAFGVGRRACAGEALCMMEAFLFMVTVVKNFKVLPPEDKETQQGSPLVADIIMKLRVEQRSEE